MSTGHGEQKQAGRLPDGLATAHTNSKTHGRGACFVSSLLAVALLLGCSSKRLMSYGEEKISAPPVQAAETPPESPPPIAEPEPPRVAPLDEERAMARPEETAPAPEPPPAPSLPERTEPVAEAAPAVSPPIPEEQLVTEPPIAEVIPEAPSQPSPAEPAVEPPAEISQPVAAVELADVYFDYDRFLIREDARSTLEANAQILREARNGTTLIEGHCDERGTISYNLLLGERRARAARQYLVDLGVPPSRIEIVSYGKERPFCTESSDDCWQSNRRAHFVTQ